MSAIEHRRGAQKHLTIAVLVVGDTSATKVQGGHEEDTADIIEREAQRAGHRAVRSTVPEKADLIRKAVKGFMADEGIDAMITTGGTGVAEHNITIEILSPYFEKELPGFGEMLRRIGYERIGVAALLSRTTAGIIRGKPIFCLPGSPDAAEVAMRLILPELGHIIKHARE